ncbi:MAG: RidA family protein [Phycisphaerales bacterium]|jgi:enamine deaminase RidA (YjgF/YER057c/UK114 family)
MSQNPNFHQILTDLGIELPKPPPAVASYVPVRVDGNHAYVSGQLPFVDGALPQTGRVGVDLSLEQAQGLARTCAVNALAALHAYAGGLDNIAGIVRVGIYVACGPDFTDHPKVGNGASELFQQVFGEHGRHARAAVGCTSLPLASPVEVEVMARLKRPVE